MKYLVLRPEASVEMIATARRIVEAVRERGDPPEVVWSEAYAELASFHCFRFADWRRRDPSGFAAAVDKICGGVRFASVREGLSLPDDWNAAGGGGDRVRKATWGAAAAMRTADLDANASVLARLTDEEVREILDGVAGECATAARRAAFAVVDGRR